MSQANLVLCIDASTPRCTLVLGALGEQTTLLASDVSLQGRRVSTGIAPRLGDLLEQSGHTPSDLQGIVCGVGPGMFTGVRVAIATAKGIALGLHIPVVGVSTLAAVAASAPTDTPGRRLALLDARRGEVYAGLYEASSSGIDAQLPDSCTALAQVLERIDQPTLALGPGVAPHLDALEAHPLVQVGAPVEGPSPAGLLRAAQQAWPDRHDAASLAAVYLRKSYAELGLTTPKRPFAKSPFVE